MFCCILVAWSTSNKLMGEPGSPQPTKGKRGRKGKLKVDTRKMIKDIPAAKPAKGS